MGGDRVVIPVIILFYRLNPPRPHGRGRHRTNVKIFMLGLNPPRPHGRGLLILSGIHFKQELKSTPPAWAGTAKIHKNWQCNPSAIRRND